MTIEELKQKSIWINWVPEPKENGKISKVPIAYNGEKTGCNNVYKNTWTTFDNVSKQSNKISFALRDNVCVIDIDDNNYDNPIIKDIVDTMDTYTEISPSGNGLHLIFTVDISKIPNSYDSQGAKKLDNKYYVKNSSKSLECYIAGLTNRFMTFTGNVFIDKPIEERTSQLLWFLNKYMLRHVPNNNISSDEETFEGVSQIVLKTINHSANVEKFKKLYFEGNTQEYDNDNSRADMALCSILAFYCGNKPELIDYMFSKSKLYREKWDRPDYKHNTIKEAIDLCNSNFYNTGVDLFLLNKFKNLQIEKQYKADDINMGRLFSVMYKNVLRYNTTQKEWFFYNSKIWTKDEQGMNAINLMKTFASTIIQYSLTIEDEAYKNYCKKLLDVKKREFLLKDCRSFLHISQEEFDTQDNLINCQNGTFNLDTFELQEHSPDDLLTKLTNAVYNPKVKSLRWEQFIKEIMEDNKNKINYLQKVLGYSLLAGNPLEIAFILLGKTRSGKGTLMGTSIYLLGGEKGYAQTIMPSSLVQKNNKQGSNASPDIAKLQNCRMVSMSEPEKNYKLDDAFFKTLTGKDIISARFLYKEPFDFIPKFTIYINSNYLLNITDPTIFESDRIAVIEFKKHFEANERDTNLKEYFKELEQLSGIFNWFLEGLKKYREEGLIAPPEIVQATKSYYYSCDTLKLFIDNEVEESQSNISVAQAWKQYEMLASRENSQYNVVGKKYFMDYIKRQPFYREQGTVNGRTQKNIIVGKKLK